MEIVTVDVAIAKQEQVDALNELEQIVDLFSDDARSPEKCSKKAPLRGSGSHACEQTLTGSMPIGPTCDMHENFRPYHGQHTIDSANQRGIHNE